MGRTVVHRIVRVGGGADLAVARNLPRVELLVLAKAPVAGRVKTRLCPPLTPAQAAEVAEAALADTLEVAVGSGADRVLLVLDGEPGPWCPVGLEIVGQVGGPLGVRLESAWSHARGPALQIGMNFAGRFRGLGAAPNRPGAYFIGADREKADQTQSLINGP